GLVLLGLLLLRLLLLGLGPRRLLASAEGDIPLVPGDSPALRLVGFRFRFGDRGSYLRRRRRRGRSRRDRDRSRRRRRRHWGAFSGGGNLRRNLRGRLGGRLGRRHRQERLVGLLVLAGDQVGELDFLVPVDHLGLRDP